MITDSFLETSFFNGYESYVICDDAYVSLEDKARMLLREFEELMLFFTIDKTYSMPQWASLIQQLQTAYKDARIGVLYKGIHAAPVDEKIKHLFLYEVGISCGCIPLQFSQIRNQQLLLNILSANEAAGRRKSIRLLCPDKFQLNFFHNYRKCEARLLDVSVSHFSCTFHETDPDLALNTSIGEIQLRLSGILFMVDARVALKRVMNGQMVYVFVYQSKGKTEGLEDALKTKMSSLICKYFQHTMHGHLNKVFHRSLVN